jgi:hypothetical protein
MASDFNVDVQKLFLGIMLSDAESFVRVQNIYNADNFDKSIKAAAKFIKEYSDDEILKINKVQGLPATFTKA